MMIVIKLKKKDLTEALHFAHKRSNDSSLYKHRGGFKSNDIVIGALGELAVYRFLTGLEIDVNHPDFTIHEAADKSYDADLQDEKGHYFHVKSQNVKSANAYGTSWLFQKKDEIVSNPKQGHYIIPTVVNTEKNEVYIMGCMGCKPLLDVYKSPKLEHLRETKKALYFDDIDAKLSIRKQWSILWSLK